MGEQSLSPLIVPVSVANGGTNSNTAGVAAANNIGALAIANNLSDVGTAATALTNLGGASGGIVKAIAQGANFTMTFPANAIIDDIVIQETAGNAITGGVRIGTTNGGTDVAVAIAVSALSLQVVPDALILSNVFSTSATQTLFVQAVTLWNGAVINLEILYRSL